MLNKKNHLISVVIPIYNSEQYLEECIVSVINQTYRNLDVLLINDGSKDTSLNICKKYEKIDSRIRVISKENEGVSATRNRGIKEAKGQWITFIDADDIVGETYIYELVQGISEDSDICFVNSTKDFSKMSTAEDISSQSTMQLDKTTLQLFERGLLNKYAIKTPIHLTSACAKLYKVDFLLCNQIFFPLDITKSEDAVFNMLVYHQAKKGAWCNKNLYYYRMNTASATHKYDVNVVENYKKHLEIIQKFYAEKKYFEYENDFDVRVCFDFIYCIVNKFCHMNNYKRYKDRKLEFLTELEQDPFKKSFQNIKSEEFSIPEKLFIFCIKNRFFCCLNFFVRIAYLLKDSIGEKS